MPVADNGKQYSFSTLELGHVFQLLKKLFLTFICLKLSTEGLDLARFSALLSRIIDNQLDIYQFNQYRRAALANSSIPQFLNKDTSIA